MFVLHQVSEKPTCSEVFCSGLCIQADSVDDDWRGKTVEADHAAETLGIGYRTSELSNMEKALQCLVSRISIFLPEMSSSELDNIAHGPVLGPVTYHGPG